MGSSQEHVAATRRRILEAARRLFKAQGYRAVTVDAVMAEAGLTRGGFYAHFPNKEALFVEALRDNPVAALLQKHRGDRDWSHRVIAEYLSAMHRENPAQGCPLGALAGDVARLGKHAQNAFGETLGEVIDELSPNPGQNDDAIAAIATMVGGIVLARATADSALSDTILDACRSHLAGPKGWDASTNGSKT